MRVLTVSLLLVSFLGAKVVITPTVGKQMTTPNQEFKDDKTLLGVGIQAYINENFAVDMRLEASEDNEMADGGKTDLERGSVNALYEFTPQNKVSPYVLAGAGYEKLHRTFLNYKSQPFYQAGAGLKISLSKNLEFITEMRYLRKKDTKDNEVIATCGFGVKLGSDECEVSCESLQSAINPKSAYSKKVVNTPKPAVKAINYKDTKEKTVVFCDEVTASKHLLKKKNLKTVKTSKVIQGNYIQVAALTQKSNLIKTVRKLKTKGFKVKTYKKTDSTVVLVGPYKKSQITSIYKRVKSVHPDAFYKKL